jgi:hypothetical protein
VYDRRGDGDAGSVGAGGDAGGDIGSVDLVSAGAEFASATPGNRDAYAYPHGDADSDSDFYGNSDSYSDRNCDGYGYGYGYGYGNCDRHWDADA